MSTIIKFNPVRAVDGNGEPVPGALARFFVTGTSTPITVFQDAGQTTPHPSPLVANAAGVFPAVYRNGATLKVEVRTPGGVMLPGFPIDPAFAIDTTGVGASGVSFSPTSEIPETNVQAAIEKVQDNLVAPLLAGGLGVTGNAPVLANVNATNTASGFYRFTDTATGDLPSGFSGETGVVYFLRETANTGWQFAARKDADGLWFRRLLAGTWQTWRRVIDGSLAADQATWDAGTDTAERPISPAKLAARIAALIRPPYAPADVAVTLGAATTFTHGLGGTPDVVQFWLVCETAEHGYSVGDAVRLGEYDDGNAVGCSTWADTTQVGAVMKSTYTINEKNAATSRNITAARWRLRVRALRFG